MRLQKCRTWQILCMIIAALVAVKKLINYRNVLALNCEFYQAYGQYTCYIANLTIIDDITNSTCRIDGNHVQLLGNRDTTEFVIDSSFTAFIPVDIARHFPNLVHFQVQHSHLREIRRNHFRGFAQLTDLTLDYNDIESLPLDVFVDLVNIEYLSLAGNKIKELPVDVLKPLKKLSWFMADSNRLTRLEKHLFDGCATSLEAVSLGSNKLLEIFVNFTRIENLKYLELRGNLCVDILLKKIEIDDETFLEGIDGRLGKCRHRHVA